MVNKTNFLHSTKCIKSFSSMYYHGSFVCVWCNFKTIPLAKFKKEIDFFRLIHKQTIWPAQVTTSQVQVKRRGSPHFIADPDCDLTHQSKTWNYVRISQFEL